MNGYFSAPQLGERSWGSFGKWFFGDTERREISAMAANAGGPVEDLLKMANALESSKTKGDYINQLTSIRNMIFSYANMANKDDSNKITMTKYNEMKKYLENVVSWTVVARQYNEAYELARNAVKTGKKSEFPQEF